MIVYLTSVNRVLVNFSGRTIWIADARRDDGSVRLHADEKLTVFMELESANRGSHGRAASALRRNRVANRKFLLG